MRRPQIFRGVWGHAPLGLFSNLGALGVNLVHFGTEKIFTTYSNNIRDILQVSYI